RKIEEIQHAQAELIRINTEYRVSVIRSEKQLEALNALDFWQRRRLYRDLKDLTENIKTGNKFVAMTEKDIQKFNKEIKSLEEEAAALRQRRDALANLGRPIEYPEENRKIPPQKAA